jgi:hypothetical protein
MSDDPLAASGDECESADPKKLESVLAELRREHESLWDDAAKSPESFRNLLLLSRDVVSAQVPSPFAPSQHFNAVIDNLWDVARDLGGADYPPPDRPAVQTETQAQQAIDSLLRWVNAKWSPPSPKRRRGQHKLPESKKQQYRDLANRWRNHPRGMTKEQFCKDEKIERETLETALRWCRKESE